MPIPFIAFFAIVQRRIARVGKSARLLCAAQQIGDADSYDMSALSASETAIGAQ